MKDSIKILTQTQGISLGNLSLPPNNEILADEHGKLSVMVKIPKLTYKAVGIADSEDPLPAFVVNGKTLPYIYVSKYQNSLDEGIPVSKPAVAPAGNLTFLQAKELCESKGTGWHLMSNAEWAAIALWCKVKGQFPQGHTNGRGSSEDPFLTGIQVETWDEWFQEPVSLTATGSGPAEWYHNQDFSGIADLTGNVAEFVSGLRIWNKQIQVIPYNNSVLALDEGPESIYWKGITATGEYANLSDTCVRVDHYGTGPRIVSAYTFGDLGTDSIENPALLQALALLPTDVAANYQSDGFDCAEGPFLVFRGGSYTSGSSAGIFSIMSVQGYDFYNGALGFRCAYVPPELYAD